MKINFDGSNLRNILLAAAVILTSTPASAYTITMGGKAVAGEGLTTSVAGATVIDFNSSLSLPAEYTGGAVVNGTTGNWASPPGDSSNYFTVGSSADQLSPGVLTLGSLNQYFGYYGGSPDEYNYIMLSHGTTEFIITGLELAAAAVLAADGNQNNGAYWNIWADNESEYFDTVKFISTSNAFETDNHAYLSAVPIPAAVWLFGTGLLGLLGMSRKRQTKSA